MQNHLRLTFVISIAALVVAAVVGGGAAWMASSPPRLSPEEESERSEIGEHATAEQSPQLEQPRQLSMEFELSVEESTAISQPKVYWLQFEGDRIRLVPSEQTVGEGSEEVVLTALMNQLLQGPAETDGSGVPTGTSAIPDGTRLLALDVDGDGVHVNVSREFAYGGGSASMILRVAQVLYTATSVDPETPVFLEVAGQPINADYPLGGEGLILEQPTSREQFTEVFSLPLS
ncbi:MAG: GerMN domain-containing protein [Cyanobacteria bacterium P01_E01_bin.34]